MITDKCSWFDCEEPSEIIVRRADAAFCKHHYILNILRLGCDLEGELIDKEQS